MVLKGSLKKFSGCLFLFNQNVRPLSTPPLISPYIWLLPEPVPEQAANALANKIAKIMFFIMFSLFNQFEIFLFGCVCGGFAGRIWAA